MFRTLAILFLSTVFLFLAINIAAWLYLRQDHSEAGKWATLYQVEPDSPQGIQLRKQIFGTDDNNFLSQLSHAPIFRAHTVLAFTNGFSLPQYTVGVQGIRYNGQWSDDFVNQQLTNKNSVFVFGGSTTWGQGVPDDKTVVQFMDRLDPEHVHLNFGVNGYDSLREVDRLLYQLRQGNIPQTVIFIDGLNDFTTFATSPYRAHDKPRAQTFLNDRGQLTLTFGRPVPRNMVMAFAYALPVTHLYFRLTEKDPGIAYGSLDANRDPLNYKVVAWYYQNGFDYASDNIDKLICDWTDYYASDIEFVRRLGKAFGFQAYFVLQPIGMLDEQNPFLTPSFKETIERQPANKFMLAATAAIRNGKLDMIDCQNALSDIDPDSAYVDATHYSPQGNQALARCIQSAIEPDLEKQTVR